MPAFAGIFFILNIDNTELPMRFIITFFALSLSIPCWSSSAKLTESNFSESSFNIVNKTFKEQWLLAAEVGLTMTSGNTQTKALLGKVNGEFSYQGGRLSYLASFYQKTVNNDKSADRWRVGFKHNIYFNEHNSTFAITEYSHDTFSSKTTTIAAGYTQRLYDNEIMEWDADIGPGFVWSDGEVDKGTNKIIHLGSKLTFKVTEQTAFEQFIIADIDINRSDKDVYRLGTSLSASIVESIKMKLSYAMKIDNVVETDREKLDTEASMSLVYIF